MKRAISVFLSICILVSMSLQLVQATDLPRFSVTNSVDGDTVSIVISVSQEVQNVGGLRLTLSFDTAKLRYVAGSRKILNTNISDSDSNKDTSTDSTVTFVVDVNQGFVLSGNVVSYQFKKLTVEDAGITLNVEEFYHLDSSLTSVELEMTSASTNVTGSNLDAKVKAVMTKIDSIGTITLEREATIKEAVDAYDALPLVGKQKVVNYSVLMDAYKTLQALKNSSAQDSDQAATNAFRERNAAALSKTPETVTIEDKAAVEKAIADYIDESVYVRALLNKDKNLLNQLKTRIGELEKIRQEQIADAQLREEAKQMAKEFREQFASVLSMTEDQIDDSLLTILTQAVGAADSNAMLNSYFLGELGEDYDKLTKYLDIAKNYVEEETPATQLLADKFINTYGYLLEMAPEEVTADEYIEILNAIAVYELLPAEAQTYVGENALTVLNKLLSIAQPLFDAQNTVKPAPPATDPAAGEEESADRKVIHVSAKGMSPVVWWLMVSCAVTVILIAVALVLLRILKAKKKQKVAGGVHNEI